MKHKNTKQCLMAGLTGLAMLLAGCGNDGNQGGGQGGGGQGGGGQGGGGQGGGVVRPTGTPNLRIGRFDTEVQPDGSVKVEAEVANTGLGPARRNSVLRVVRVAERGPSPTLLDLQVAPIGPGRQSGKLRGVIPAGQLQVSSNLVLRARADATGQISEGRKGERDNFQDMNIQFGPDIVLKGIGRDPGSIKDPRNLTVLAIVGNNGNVNTGAFSAVWQYKVKETPVGAVDRKDLLDLSWKTLETTQIGNLAPGQDNGDLKVAFPANLAQEMGGKNVVVRLVLDPDNRVRELTRENNRGGASHEFPPNKPDINVIGLLAWWNDRSADLHFHSLIANSGNGPAPAFQSQWFRLEPGSTGAEGGLTGSSGNPNAPWKPLSGLLDHKPIPALTWEGLRSNPEFKWSPDAQEEGKLVVLKYEADIGNKVDEETDPKGPDGKPIVPPPADPNQQQGQTPPPNATVTTGNGPNNSFVWNFQVPRLARADLSVRYLASWVTEDRDRVRIEAGVSNFGSIPSGPFKVIASVDGASAELNIVNLPPSQRVYKFGFVSTITPAMRRAGKSQVTVRVVPSKSERETRNDSLSHSQQIPRDLLPPDIAVAAVQVEFQRSGEDKEHPNRVDRAVVRYMLFNTGEEPTGPYKVNIGIEGGPSDGASDEDGIQPGRVVIRQTEPLDINGMASPDRFVPVQAKLEVSCPEDKNPTNNRRESNTLFLVPRPPDKPAPLPDLMMTSIRLRPTSTRRNVHFRATVTNQGLSDSPMYRMDWYINEKPVQKMFAPGLRRGASSDDFDAHWCDYQPTRADGDKLRIMVLLDPRNVIREEDESNNEAQAELDIDGKGAGQPGEPIKFEIDPEVAKQAD